MATAILRRAVLLAALACLAGRASAQSWTFIGPTPITSLGGLTDPRNFNTGRVIALAVDPVDPSHWLAGAATGGIWETRDAGSTWSTRTDAFPTLAIGKIAFSPSNPSVIYAGTGEANFSRDGHVGVGMLRSTDGGATWALLAASTFARGGVAAVRVHPSNPAIVEAITARASVGRFTDSVSSPPSFGVQKSTDGGVTWTRTLAGQATGLEIDPANFANQYAAIGDPLGGLTNDTPGGLANGVYRSLDSGQTWAAIPGPWGVSTPTRPTTGRIMLAMAPSNSNVLYAGIQLPPTIPLGLGLLGLYRTDNAWSATPTWIQVPTDATGMTGYCDRQCGSAHSLSVDPSDPTTVFAGGVTLWRCRSCGPAPTWTDIGQRIHPDHRILIWQGNRLIDGNDGGVVSSTDRGDSWQNHNVTLSSAQLFTGALHPNKPDVILTGSKDNGCLVHVGGLVWAVPAVPQHGVCEGDVAMSSTHPDTDWMTASDFGQVNRSTDGGRSFVAAASGINEPQDSVTTAVRKCPNNDDVFLTGNQQLWRTNNFFSAPSPLWFANGPAGVGRIRGIAFAESDLRCGTYAFGTLSGQVRLTTNGGASWIDVDPARIIPGRTVNSLAFDPVDARTLYVALSGFDDGTPGHGGHIFKTTNATSGSPTWSNISPPDNAPQNVIIIDPADRNLVAVGADAGVWFSQNGGTNWVHMGPEAGMPNVPVYDLKIHPTARVAVAFTFGRGIYMMPLSAKAGPSGLTSTVAGPAVTLAWQPPNSELPVSYLIEAGSSTGTANLAAFDTGSAATTLTVPNVPAGTYFVRVRARTPSGTSPPSNEVIVIVR